VIVAHVVLPFSVSLLCLPRHAVRAFAALVVLSTLTAGGEAQGVPRSGKPMAARKGGNAPLPLIQRAYVQPVARSVVELASTGVDLSLVLVRSRWNDRPVWIAGAISDADTTSPQLGELTMTRWALRGMFQFPTSS
jgi:hypothetical protein